MAPYFGVFICIWMYLRHYINLCVLWATLTEFRTVGPFELDWETQQYKCWISQYITFALLACLQALNLYWIYVILRIAYKLVFHKIARDDREDDEDEDEDEDGERARHGILGDAGGLLCLGECMRHTDVKAEQEPQRLGPGGWRPASTPSAVRRGQWNLGNRRTHPAETINDKVTIGIIGGHHCVCPRLKRVISEEGTEERGKVRLSRTGRSPRSLTGILMVVAIIVRSLEMPKHARHGIPRHRQSVGARLHRCSRRARLPAPGSAAC